MPPKHRTWAAVVSLVGLTVSASYFLRFLRGWATNALPVGDGMSRREVYGVVGRMYADGFVAGFFTAFSLVVLSIAVSSWWEERERSRERLHRSAHSEPAAVAE